MNYWPMILYSYQYNLFLDNAFLLTFIQRFIIRINPEIGELQYIHLIKVTPVMIPGTPQYIKHVFKCFPIFIVISKYFSL